MLGRRNLSGALCFALAAAGLAACSGGAGSDAPGGSAANAPESSKVAGIAALPAAGHLVRAGVRRNIAEPTCTGVGTGGFVGVTGWFDAAGENSAVVAGEENDACGVLSFVGGGDENAADSSSENATVSGGLQNYIIGSNAATIAGGESNLVNNGVSGSVGGGTSNSVTEDLGTVGGGSSNANGSYGGTIAGGANNTEQYANYAFIGGGLSNTITTSAFSQGAIAGGTLNVVSGSFGFVGGGSTNTAAGEYSGVAGGFNNKVTGEFGAIGGGESNQASGEFATVPGGQLNVAHGVGSFAAGMGSNANDNGDFVWSDDPSGGATAITVTGDNEFLVRSRGGVIFYTSANLASGVKLPAGSGAWESLSDRNVKTGIVPVSDGDILAKVTALPISEWSYTTERGVRHVGPMAQDFYAAFDVGEDDRHITSIDEDGVALAAIKALNAKVTQRDAAIAALQRKDATLERHLEALAVQVREIQAAVK